MSLPNNSFYPLFPVQQTTFDKDTGLALAAGTYTFYRDTAPSSTKDVYQRTENPDNTFTYASLGYVLQLSAIGTFVDDSGNNITPFLWPFEGSPTDDPVSTTIDLYYIKVESSGGTDQFTVSAWPPEVQGASSTVNQVLSSTNIVSNPQFAVINYPSPYTFTVSGNTTTQIAPDWNVITSSSGTFTISQEPSVDPAAPGAPAFALRIATNGIGATLSQTVSNSPRVLETGFAAGTFIVKSNIMTTATVNMNYVPSSPSLTTKTICTAIAVNGSYTAAYETQDLTDLTINPDDGSTGYVNVQLTIPLGADVSISCVQLISVPSETIVPAYIQDPTTRQIDHLYHDAYPIVPVGTVIDFAGYTAPSHYFRCNGDAPANSRVLYNKLMLALTLTDTISTTIGVNTFTDTNAALFYIGCKFESPNFPASTTISAITGTTITASANATITGSASITYFPWGNGDGSTTFNIPLIQGYGTAGAGGNLIAVLPLVDALGMSGGAASSTALVNHSHGPLGLSFVQGGAGGSGPFSGQSGSTFSNYAATASAGTGASFSLVQPTVILNKYIRFE